MSVRVEAEDGLYSIRWEHGEDATFCIIEQHVVGDEWIQVREAVARRHPEDPYCKETGRKISLTRALADSPRAMRATFWKAYFDRNLIDFKRALEEREGI